MDSEKEYPEIPTPRPRKPITPSLATLEKAVAAKIYFENLYFPLLRHPPSREQRRVAMEKEMANMQMSEAQKENIRRRWRQNETEYLRDRRRKVDVNAFAKLKTIGHGAEVSSVRGSVNQHLFVRVAGAFGVVSLVRERSTGQLFAMKQVTSSFPPPTRAHQFNSSHHDIDLVHFDSCAKQICSARDKRATSELNVISSGLLRLLAPLGQRSGSSSCFTVSRTVIIYTW